MAKTSSIQRNLKRIRLAKKFLKKRDNLKKIIKNKKLPLEERFAAQLKLSKITFGKLQSFLFHYLGKSHSIKTDLTNYPIEQEPEFESDSAALISDYTNGGVIGEPDINVKPEVLEHTNLALGVIE